MNITKNISGLVLLGLLLVGCQKEESQVLTPKSYPAVSAKFGTSIDLNNLTDYANQGKPAYITRDNTADNQVTNAGATLGRVLFYDKALSVNNTVACASCHKQTFAFGDTAQASKGVNGLTGRHSMRLVNARFANERKFFWDERAATLEVQTTRPIQDHAEMGFSGKDGDPDLNALIAKLDTIDYYKELFAFVYGDSKVSEARIQNALAQFVRSIQSFDSKYDIGRAQAPDNQNFPNFSALENQGKELFLARPAFNANGVRVGGGVGCQGCHAAPEFDIDPNTLNNGFISKIGGGTDLLVTRAPSLRDMLKADGSLNGGLMHTGTLKSLNEVLNHYDKISLAANTNLDPRLRPNGNPQNLQLTDSEKDALVAFLKTLSGTDIYTAARWSNPFKESM